MKYFTKPVWCDTLKAQEMDNLLANQISSNPWMAVSKKPLIFVPL